MKFYKVGGFVRDKLLGITANDCDHVVVGATMPEMLELGFKKVGRSFPVFLHPKTFEEYALARTEIKTGSGYCEFRCDFNPNITLEDDLKRRDLTINAMAMDDSGQIIDPFNGQKDLKNKLLRHVSQAFVEDPVRVLRIARFMAKFKDFTIANSTLNIMYDMVCCGEVRHLVAERVWQELEKSLKTAAPQLFFETLHKCGALSQIIPEISRLFGIPDVNSLSGDIDSGISSMKLLKKIAAQDLTPQIRFAALVFNIGKINTSYNKWPEHKNVADSSSQVIKNMQLAMPRKYLDFSLICAKYFEIFSKVAVLPSSKILEILYKTKAMQNSANFSNFVSFCSMITDNKVRAQQWLYIFSECAKVNTAILLSQGFTGKSLGDEIKNRQISIIELIKAMWEKDER